MSFPLDSCERFRYITHMDSETHNTNRAEPAMNTNWTPFELTVKNTPRSRKVHTWIRFGSSAEQVAEQTLSDTRRDSPELVILAIEPTEIKRPAADAPVTVREATPEKGHYLPYENVGLPVPLGTGKHGSYPGETAYWRGDVDASGAWERLNDIPDTPATRLKDPADFSL